MSNLALKTTTPYESSGGRLITADGRALPLKSASLEADAKGGVARAVLRQRFTNPYSEPLAVTYLMPLPADGAVSGYAFTIGERRIVGEVDRKAAARERFEQAIVEGRTAALVDQERSSLFTQEIGNIPPGAELVAELSIDQKLAWLPDGAWEWRFPTVVAPRYMGEPGRVHDIERVTVDVADKPLPVQLDMSLTIRDALLPGKHPESPSHPIRAIEDAGRFAVSLSEDRGAALDRDVVVRWPAAQQQVGLSLDVYRRKGDASAAYGLLTIVPPTPESQPKPLARDLIVLLDTSGSMSGEPLAQARRVVSALVDSLTDDDKLEMIEFSSAPRRWKSRAVNATSSNRAEAQRWLAKLQASGGTEMRSGILEAFAPLREDSQRQIVLVTDGLIGSEDEVISAICDELPASSRVHVVGVGSSVNRSLTGPASRAGRGAELVIGIGEDAERAAKRLVARTNAPLITELSVSGSAIARYAPERLPDLFAGSPALLSLELRGTGEIIVRGRTADGLYESRLQVPAVDPGIGSSAIAALFGREAVEDLELQIAAGTPRAEIDPKIEKLGLELQISTRLTSWIAVSDKVMVDPTAPTRREKVPQMLPHGMSIEGLGLRAVSQGMGPLGRAPMSPMAAPPPSGVYAPSPAPARPAAAPPPQKSAKGGGIADGLFDAFGGMAEKAKEVFLGRAKTEAFEGSAADEEAPASRARPEPEAAAPRREVEKKADAPKPAAGKKRAQLAEGEPRQLSGRVLLRKDRELVIELTVDGAGLEWDPANRATLRLADGTVVSVEVDLPRSTRPMSAGAGLVLRVTLALSQPLSGTPALLELTNQGELLAVSL